MNIDILKKKTTNMNAHILKYYSCFEKTLSISVAYVCTWQSGDPSLLSTTNTLNSCLKEPHLEITQ